MQTPAETSLVDQLAVVSLALQSLALKWPEERRRPRQVQRSEHSAAWSWDMAQCGGLGVKTMQAGGAAAAAYARVKAQHLQTAAACEGQGVRFQPMVFESTGAFDASTGQVLQQLARAVAARAGGDASELHGQLLQELCSTVRTFRARAALRRRVELGENTGVAAAAVVLRAPADDYVETDLRSLLSSISRRRSVVSLRATGHLLVGACKIYVKKCSIFEEEAEEVRTALMMAFSRPTDMQAAEELAPIREVRTHTAPPDQALLGGKRHMARIEDITLKDSKEATVLGSLDLDGPSTDDLFGSLSQGELQAGSVVQLPSRGYPGFSLVQEVTRLVRKRVLPKGALEAR
ncbi:unnamed protein product [Cladocopium goreaui]|uniref:40S ribosomal protein S24 n=1 Tax=Cladocopium goreaui TaxID=2562237 RepID=A0A9P1BZ10_9DINO|nr:unnamed protein product [Cladocopium goreaui]